MMKAPGQYDAELQMFRETNHALDLARLRFLRWMVEQGRLEHGPAGPPGGRLAELLAERLAKQRT